MVATSHIAELNQLSFTKKGILFGGAITLSTMDTVLKKAVQSEHEYRTRTFVALIDMLRVFAGYQVRNVAVGYLCFVTNLFFHL